MASFMGRRQVENWKSLFSGVWRAEYQREVTVDNELSQTAPCRLLAFGGTVDRQGRKESKKALSLPGIRRDFTITDAAIKTTTTE